MSVSINKLSKNWQGLETTDIEWACETAGVSDFIEKTLSYATSEHGKPLAGFASAAPLLGELPLWFVVETSEAGGEPWDALVVIREGALYLVGSLDGPGFREVLRPAWHYAPITIFADSGYLGEVSKGNFSVEALVDSVDSTLKESNSSECDAVLESLMALLKCL